MSAEVIETAKGKPSLILDGVRYRLHRRTEHTLSWLCVKERSARCRGRVKTTGEYVVLESFPHQSIPNLAEIEVNKAQFVCKKRAREELTYPVSQIFKEEYGKLLDRGYELVTEVPKYDNAKSNLCKVRRKALGAIQNPTTNREIELGEEIMTLSDGSSFLLFDFDTESGKRCLVFSAGIGKQKLKSNDVFFLDGTFKSCPKQFKQIYTILSDFGSTNECTNVWPLAYAMLEDKRKSTYVCLFNKFKDWGWSPKTIKIDYEVAVIEAITEVFPNTEVTGCLFHFNQCLWRQVQHLGLVQDYKENEEVRMVCRMCSTLALIPEEKVEDAWIFIMENKPIHRKLESFLDYFVDQWMDNPSIPIKMWNVHGQRHRTNNPVEGWNCKLNKAVGIPHPNFYYMVKKLKQDALDVRAKIMQLEMCLPNNKRRKKYIEIDERIRSILSRYLEDDLFKCLRLLAYTAKFE